MGIKLDNEMVSQFNTGDIISTVLIFLFILGIFVVSSIIVRLRFAKQQQSKKSIDIGQKLDRIIELLEQDKK